MRPSRSMKMMPEARPTTRAAERMSLQPARKSLAMGERGLLGRGGALAPVVVELVHGTAVGLGFHAGGIPKDEGYAYDCQHHPAEEAVFETREERYAGDALRYADSEWIEHGSGKTHMGSHIAHADTHDAVVAHLDGQRDEHHDEGYRLLAHAENGAEKAEEQHDEGDDDIVHPQLADELVAAQALHTAQESHHADVDGVAVVEYPEGAADHEDEYDDVGLVYEAVKQGAEDLPRLRRGVDAVEGVVQHHLSPALHDTGVFACRHHPGEDGGQDDEAEDYGEGMRYFLHIETR